MPKHLVKQPESLTVTKYEKIQGNLSQNGCPCRRQRVFSYHYRRVTFSLSWLRET